MNFFDVIKIIALIIFWLAPSLLATWMLWRIFKKDVYPEIAIDVDKYGLTVADLIALTVFTLGVLFILVLSWIPLVNFMMIKIYIDHDPDWDLDEIYIIKPRNEQTASRGGETIE